MRKKITDKMRLDWLFENVWMNYEHGMEDIKINEREDIDAAMRSAAEKSS